VDTDLVIAKAEFKKRFKYEPEICVEHKGLIWVGPIKKENNNET